MHHTAPPCTTLPQFIALGLMILLLSGCATLINGDTVPITVTAQEPDTKVKANGQTYETPVVLQLPRGLGTQSLTFMKEGEENRDVILQETASAWIFGNVIWGLLGVIFILVDAANPHGYSLSPDEVTFSFAAPVVAESKPSAEFDSY